MAEKKKRRSTLASRRSNALPLLAMGMSAKQVAEKIGCTEQNVYDWLRDQEYRDEVIEQRTRYLDQAAGVFSASVLKAVTKIRNLVDSTNESVSLAAAKTLLEYSIKYYHMINLEDRLKRVEARLDETTYVPTIIQPSPDDRAEDPETVPPAG